MHKIASANNCLYYVNCLRIPVHKEEIIERKDKETTIAIGNCVCNSSFVNCTQVWSNFHNPIQLYLAQSGLTAGWLAGRWDVARLA